MAMTRQNLISRVSGISAGVFAAPLGALGKACADIAAWGGTLAHFDIMDGVFVPQITGGPGFVAAAGPALVRDVHLMVAAPSRQAAAFVKAGADIITIHAEAPDAAAAFDEVRSASKAAGRPVLLGLGIMPDTPTVSLEELLAAEPDMVLVLSLDPRTGRPPDVAAACQRVEALRSQLPDGTLIAFDGGVTEATMEQIARARPDVVVAGSAVFGAADPRAAFRHLGRSFAGGMSEEAVP